MPTLSFITQSSFIRFRDSFNVTGIDGSISHTIDVIAEPPLPDFGITANPISATVQCWTIQGRNHWVDKSGLLCRNDLLARNSKVWR